MVRLPGINSILKHAEITFYDKSKSLKLSLQEVITFEMKYTRNSPIVYGYFIFNDYHDITSNIDIKDCSIEVYFNDVFSKSFLRRFKVIEMSEGYTQQRSKMYMLFLVDEISHALNNIYISKSFSGSRVDAFKSVLSEYKIFDLLYKTQLKSEFSTDSSQNNSSFVLSTNMSFLDFFMEEFERIGYSFYQTREGLFIKSFDEILPSKLEEIKDEFVQESNVQLYKHLILQLNNKPSSSVGVIANPNKKTYYFDEKQKKMVPIEDTFETLKNDISINNDNRNLQSNHGTKAAFQNRLDSAQHKNKIRESYLETFKLEIVVNGYFNNDINKIYSVQLQGHKSTTKTQIEGNIISSGKYVGLSVTDKLIGDKLIQRVTLGRSDSQK